MLADLQAVGLLDGNPLRRGVLRIRRRAGQQAGPYRDPVQALGERWTRDARKRAAARHLDEQAPHSALARSSLDDLVAAPAQPHDPAMSSRAHEREIPDGLGIEL